MKRFLNYKSLTIAALVAVAIIIPVTVVQVMQQQEIRQRADEVVWATNQSASSKCPTGTGGAQITVTFSNTEPRQSSTSMDVVAKDLQTGKSVDLGSIPGGEVKSDVINTGQATLNAGTVEFSLSWSNDRSGTDKKTASYKAVTNCNPPTATPPPSPTPSVTPSVTPTPSPTPSGTPSPSPSATPTQTPTPTPTVCPTLGPVTNVRIDCPNCK